MTRFIARPLLVVGFGCRTGSPVITPPRRASGRGNGDEDRGCGKPLRCLWMGATFVPRRVEQPSPGGEQPPRRLGTRPAARRHVLDTSRNHTPARPLSPENGTTKAFQTGKVETSVLSRDGDGRFAGSI